MPEPVEVYGARAVGIARALDARAQPGAHRLHPDIVWFLDAQRDGLVPPRVRHVRLAFAAGPLAAVEYRAAIGVAAAPETSLRVLRAHAYVRDSAIGAQPREATLRALTAAELRWNGQLLRDVDAPPDASVAISSTVPWARATPLPVVDSDILASGAGAVRLSYESQQGLVLVGAPREGAGFAVLEFYWRRTPALNDNDTAVLALSYIAAPAEVIPVS